MLTKNLQKKLAPIAVAVLFIMMSYRGISQPAINGPACVMPGTTYQYMITGQWDSSSNTRVCIVGGKLDSGDSCVSLTTSPSMLLVIWSDTVDIRQIQISCDLGNASLDITGTAQLDGGTVDDSDEVQILSPDQFVYTFHCEDAAGGSCTPNYLYQWQSSANQLNWTNVSGATGKDLQYSGTITTDTFFRRVTTETHANTVTYSDAGLLMMVYE